MSQFLSISRTTHLQAVMNILRYLKKPLGGGLLYSDHGHTRVAGFSEATGQGAILIRDRPHDIVFFGGNLVS